MEIPSAYIPMDRRQAIAQGKELPERAQGAALFADISGFTPLTEMLARTLGPRRGAEELTAYLNLVYDALITELHSFGGSVIGFSGDAITCWFSEDEALHDTHSSIRRSALRAIATALAMQTTMSQFSSMMVVGGETVSLAMKTAVVAGSVRRFVVGDPDYTLIDAMAGTTLEQLATAEHQAEKGDVILDAATAELLGDTVQIAEWRTDEHSHERFAAITALSASVPEQPWPTLPPDALSEDQVRAWLLPSVYRQLQAGQGRFLAELRPAAALFLRFGGIDYDKNPQAPTQLDTFIRQVQQILQRYDGSLLQLTIGDKGSYLYAAFGAPIAHEDDVDRAALAALDLQRLSEQLEFIDALQIGITYGRMRAGAYGGVMRRTYGVLGDSVNLSARLMQTAKPGQILVSDEAQTKASDTFFWEPLPPIRVKGKSNLIDLYRLVGMRRQRSGRSLTALFPLAPVGRQKIIAQLETTLATLGTGQGRVVRLEGEAGMGKSHLVAHFSRVSLSQGTKFVLGACQGITHSVAYYPWRQIFTTLLNLEERTEEAAITHLTTLVQTEYPQWAVRLPLLGDLLLLPIPDNPTTAALDKKLRQQSLFSLLVEIIQAQAQKQPLALVLENAHWLDEASSDLVKTVAQQAVSTAPVLLILVHRPPLLGEELLLLGLNKLPVYQELTVGEMPHEEIAVLVESQLKGHPSSLLLAIIEKTTRGNPFFVNELLDAMRRGKQIVSDQDEQWHIAADLLNALQKANFVVQAEGQWQLKPDADLSTVKLGLPDSIHALVLSRLDRLPESHKLTLKVSSVIGHIIDLVLLADAHPESKGLIQLEVEATYMTDEDLMQVELPEKKVYAFRHHTTQEVTYETLLHTQRQQLHRAVAETLAQQQPEAIPQIAHHAFLGEVWSLALHYNVLAGEQARQLHANQQGIDFLQKALQSSHQLPETETAESRKRIHLALAELLIAVGQYESATEHLKAGLLLAQASQDREAEARVYFWYGRSHELRGEYTNALSWLEKGFEALDGHLSLEEAEICLIAGLIHVRQGNYEQALQLCERGLKVGQLLNDAAIRARIYNLMGIVELRHNSVAAIDRSKQSLAQFEQLGNIYGQASSHNLIANGYFALGELSQADTYYRRSLDLFTQTGNIYNQVVASNNLGGIALKQGRLDAALGYYQRAMRQMEQIGGSLWVFGALHLNIGHTHLRRQELSEAMTQLQVAEAYMKQNQGRDFLPELYGLLAEVQWQQGEIEAAVSTAQKSITLAQELKMPREEGHTLRILGEIAQATNTLPQAQQYFQQSYNLLSQANDEYETACTWLSWAALLAAQGQIQQAQEILAKCVVIFGRLEAQLDLAKAQHLQSQLWQL